MVISVGDTFWIDPKWRSLIKNSVFDESDLPGLEWFTQTMSVAFAIHERFKVTSVEPRLSRTERPSVYLRIEPTCRLDDEEFSIREFLGSEGMSYALEYFPRAIWRYEVWFLKEALIRVDSSVVQGRVYPDFSF